MYRWTALVTLASLALYFFMLFRVGLLRGKTGIKAPATTGHPDFERAYRIQMNTLEGMPLFLPALWLAAVHVDDRFAAVIGLLWIAGRILYMRLYTIDPDKRGPGFGMQATAFLILYAAALIGVLRAFFV